MNHACMNTELSKKIEDIDLIHADYGQAQEGLKLPAAGLNEQVDAETGIPTEIGRLRFNVGRTGAGLLPKQPVDDQFRIKKAAFLNIPLSLVAAFWANRGNPTGMTCTVLRMSEVTRTINTGPSIYSISIFLAGRSTGSEIFLNTFNIFCRFSTHPFICIVETSHKMCVNAFPKGSVLSMNCAPISPFMM